MRCHLYQSRVRVHVCMCSCSSPVEMSSASVRLNTYYTYHVVPIGWVAGCVGVMERLQLAWSLVTA